LRFSLYTNATLVGPEEARFLAGLRRLRAVQVSLDAGSADGHDACRGAGSFERAVRGIRAMQECGLPLSLQVTLHRLNAPDLEQTARFVLEDLGLPSFQINSVYDMGTCSDFASRSAWGWKSAGRP
jgi:MoaA/NifB/PqqE/SkfB family radical SAM enzyme